MINLAIKEIVHTRFRYFLTAVGLGLLIGTTLTMVGLVRGMAADAVTLIRSSNADLWVVQKNTEGPFAESSTMYDDVYRSIAGLRGVAGAANAAYLTLQIGQGNREVRALVVGFDPDSSLGAPPHLVAGRPITRSHYEAIADVKTGFKVGDKIMIRRDEYTVVGLTSGMVSSSGDPVVFITLQDAQTEQFEKDNDYIYNERARLAANPEFNPPDDPGLLQAITSYQESSNMVNAVLVRVAPGYDPNAVAAYIRRWKYYSVYTYQQMAQLLLVNVNGIALRQLGMFMAILTIVGVAIIMLIIYIMTMGKIKEIAILKLIGAKNRTIVSMILQEAWGLGVLGFFIGKIAASLWAPLFPKRIEFIFTDSITAFLFTMFFCTLASVLSIRAALKVQPSSAIGD